MSRKLFVANLSSTTTRKELENFFALSGYEADATVPLDQQTGRPRGFAFVSLRSEQEVEDALSELAGVRLAGRPLRIERAPESERRGARSDDYVARRDEPGLPMSSDVRWHSSQNRPDTDDYVERHRYRRRRGGKHGSDRLRRHGVRRRID